jgi:hypothetical protein
MARLSLHYPLLMTAPFGQVLKKSVGNSIRVNIMGQNLLNTAPFTLSGKAVP